MFYRIRIDLAFTELSDLDDILDKTLDKLPESHTINPGQVDEERGFIQVQECYHDEDTSKPCISLESHQSPLEP